MSYQLGEESDFKSGRILYKNKDTWNGGGGFTLICLAFATKIVFASIFQGEWMRGRLPFAVVRQLLNHAPCNFLICCDSWGHQASLHLHYVLHFLFDDGIPGWVKHTLSGSGHWSSVSREGIPLGHGQYRRSGDFSILMSTLGAQLTVVNS